MFRNWSSWQCQKELARLQSLEQSAKTLADWEQLNTVEGTIAELQRHMWLEEIPELDPLVATLYGQ